MAYGANILPRDAAFYTLDNASMSNGVLSLGVNGSATLRITEDILGTFPDSFRFNLASNLYNNLQKPDIYCIFNITTADSGECIYITPSQEHSTDIFSTVVSPTSKTYVYCTLTIRATKACRITLWELCPYSGDNIDTIIEGVTQSLPKLLYDYNEVETQVAQEKTLIGIITSRLQQSTDLQGHLLVNCVLSEYSTVYITLRDEDTDELYSPLKFTLQAGQNTITIPHSYLKRQAGLHSFRAYMQVTNGTAIIPVRGVLYTIDGGYMAEALDDLALTVKDFTIMQTVPSAGPEKIWCCGTKITDGIENLIIQSSRGFATTDWDQLYTLPNTLGAAIEYNGTWVKRPDGVGHTLLTEDVPWLFYINANKQLMGAKCDNLSNAIVLATNVTQVSACRGYNSLKYSDQDQGLVIAYVSGGKAYYRQYYVNNPVLGVNVWTVPVELDNTKSNVIGFTVHRLNDYRLGFLLNDGVSTTWYYTVRTYISDTSATEEMDASLRLDRKLMSMTPPEMLLYGRKGPLWGEDLYTWHILFDAMLEWWDPEVPPTYSITINYYSYYGDLMLTESAECFDSYSTDGVYIIIPAYEYKDYFKTEIIVTYDLPEGAYLRTSENGHGVQVTQRHYELSHIIEQEDPTITVPGYGKDTMSVSIAITSSNIISRGMDERSGHSAEILAVDMTISSHNIVSAEPIETENVGSEALHTSIAINSSTIKSLQTGVDPI